MLPGSARLEVEQKAMALCRVRLRLMSAQVPGPAVTKAGFAGAVLSSCFCEGGRGDALRVGLLPVVISIHLAKI